MSDCDKETIQFLGSIGHNLQINVVEIGCREYISDKRVEKEADKIYHFLLGNIPVGIAYSVSKKLHNRFNTGE